VESYAMNPTLAMTHTQHALDIALGISIYSIKAHSWTLDAFYVYFNTTESLIWNQCTIKNRSHMDSVEFIPFGSCFTYTCIPKR
jgi:hypothetical protein